MRHPHEVRGSSNHTLSSIIMTPTKKVTWSFYMVKYSSAPRGSMFLHNVDTTLPQGCRSTNKVFPAVTQEVQQWLHAIDKKLPVC